ncbi:LacI family DNA-binding transcriptional regulator [Agrococcus versicolor]|uniref:LacI family DNA-binding transcriptional regulator n=1 Tax=Agrococcus versicolor TaxID=501482 RepID=A0ABP5MIP3_9MICO
MADRPLQVTVEDVAREAGVSRSTATRALRGHGRIAEATRTRVESVAGRLGYVPNLAASDLAAGGTGVVGLMLRDAANPVYGALFSRIEVAARDAGLELVTVTIGADPGGEQQVQALGRLLGMRVAGLLVATGGVDSHRLEPFASEVPIVRVGRDEPSAAIHAESYDEAWHGGLLAARAHELGHARVVVLGAEAATSFGEHERAEALVASLGATRVDRVATGAAPDDGVRDALAAVDAGATAVLCASDTRQLAVLRALAERGVDCSTSGWDGILPGLDLLGLSTVRVPVESAADAAVERLAALLDGDVDLPIHRRWRGELLPGRTLRPVEHA